MVLLRVWFAVLRVLGLGIGLLIWFVILAFVL